MSDDYSAQATVSPAVFRAIMREYRTLSDRAGAATPARRDLRYDDAAPAVLDVFGPGTARSPRPVVVMVHGGYWRMLSRHDTAFMVEVLHAHGIATVVPDYGLAPATALSEIVRQMRASIAWVVRHGPDHGLDPGRLVVAGSSAGAHLAASCTAPGWHSQFGLGGSEVRGLLAVSGLFDLRPLVDAPANDWLHLTPETAPGLSPVLAGGITAERVVVARAEHEAPGFVSQSEAYAQAAEGWIGPAAVTRLVEPRRNHFDVFLDFAREDSALTRALVGLVGSLG